MSTEHIDLLRKRYRRARHYVLRRTVRWSGIALGGGLMFGAAYFMVVESDLYRLKQLKVSGTVHIQAQEIRSIFMQVLEQNLLTLDLQPLMQKALEQPWVKEVRVRKTLPDTLVIQILERVPAAVLESRSGSYWVDTEGMMLGPAGPLKSVGAKPLPHLTGIAMDGLVRRDPHHLNRLQTGMSLIRLVQGQPGSESSGRDPGESLALDMSHGQRDPRLYVGDYLLRLGEGAYGEKWKRFLTIREDLKARGLAPEEIDLRFPDQVIVKTF